VNWFEIESEVDLDQLQKNSFDKPQIIFKHSTRCSISAMAKGRLDSAPDSDALAFHYLDLIQYRALSNEIADRFHIAHQSPQALLIKNGECVLELSHWDIRYDELLSESLNSAH